MVRVKSGIPGLDELLDGGFLESSTVLISGGAGTGKTILSTEFAYKGAKEYDEPGIYITLEEGATNIWWNMKNFRWDVTRLEQEDMLKIYKVGMIEPQDFADSFEREINKIKNMIDDMDAKRIVIDSTTAFGMWMGSKPKIRHSLFKLSEELKDMDVTALLTSEAPESKNEFSRFGVEEFITDGVIALYFKPPQRALFVRKMRGIDHDKKPHPFEITSSGIEIDSKQEVLWESLE